MPAPGETFGSALRRAAARQQLPSNEYGHAVWIILRDCMVLERALNVPSNDERAMLRQARDTLNILLQRAAQ